jgi:F0F1-type ATP synthase membrane subunit b/b'
MIQSVAVTASCVGWALFSQIPLSVLLAQAPATHATGGEELFWRSVNTLGAIGILAWYFYRTQTKTIPDKDAQITAEREASDAKLKTTLDAHAATVTQLVAELKQEREERMTMVQQCGRSGKG